MAKSKIRLARPIAGGPPARRHGPASRQVGSDETAAAGPKKAAAHTVRLAAEIDRLQAELAAARAQIAQLEARADVDALLDMLNRCGFERELRRSLAYVRRYGTSAALIYLDLDNFKPVNDQHGHAAGDRVLQTVAAALRSSVRESDVVARLGGDEFGALLWNVDEGQAAAKAAELEAAIAEAAVPHGGVSLSVEASAGFAMLDLNDAPADVVARADSAMYARKHGRRTAAE